MPTPRLTTRATYSTRPCFTLIAAILLTAGAASANSTGISGFSGRTSGVFCTACHAGGTTPTVQLEGPMDVLPNEMVTFRFTVRSQSTTQIAGGLDVSASGGTLGLIDGEGTRLLAGELTHTTPKNNIEGAASFQFTWQAPAAEGAYTVFAAGNSVNRDLTQLGDRAQTTTLIVNVAQAADTPTPTPTPTPTVSRPPTNTRAPVPCVGDCDESGDVAVNELVRGVNILLEQAPINQCPDFDTDASDTVTINELVAAVNALLGGCQ